MTIEQIKENVKASYLTAQDLKIAVSLLYQSYHDDPVFLDIFSGDKPDYEQRLRSAIREELNSFWQAKQPIIGLYLEKVMVGVVCLSQQNSGFNSERLWHWRLKMLLTAGYFSTKQFIEKEKKIMSAVPLKSFHMLSFIAVHPLHQHHGFGHYLMAAVNTVLAQAPESEGVAVFATTNKYQQFFSSVDYQLIKEIDVGKVSGALMVHYRDK